MKRIIFDKESFEKVLNGEKVFLPTRTTHTHKESMHILLNKNIFSGNLMELAHGKQIYQMDGDYEAILQDIGDDVILDLILNQKDDILIYGYIASHPRKEKIKDLLKNKLLKTLYLIDLAKNDIDI